MPARGLSDQRDSLGIHLVFRSIRFHEPHRGLHIVGFDGKLELRCEAIVDAEPGKSSITQWLKDVRNVLLLVTGNPSSAMDEYGCGKRAISIRNMSVQSQMNPIRLAILNIFKVRPDSAEAKDCRHEHAAQQLSQDFHKEEA